MSSKDDSLEDKKVKVSLAAMTEEDAEVSSMEDSLLNKYPEMTSFLVENVRFTPRVVEFTDAFEGKQFSENFTIQNVGRNPVTIKIGEPNSFIFQLKKPTTRARFLPSGTSVTKTITYTYHNDDLVQRSQIPIWINGYLVEHPIVVKKAVPEIEVHPQKLNFEKVDLGTSAKSMTLTIHNSGGKRTKFEIDCGKQLDLVVSPMRGTIKPKQFVTVRVDIMGFCEGEFYRELWIKTTEVPIRVPVLVEVVRPRLALLYPMGTQDFTLIDFPPAFHGTQRVSTFVLKNMSNETNLYVALAEVDGKLEVLKNRKNLPDPFDMFVVLATEGILAPFESRICRVLFRPKSKVIKKGWHHIEGRETQKICDHIAYFRIETLYFIGREELEQVEMQPVVHKAVIEKSGLLQKSSIIDEIGSRDIRYQGDPDDGGYESEEKTLKFCLHGKSVSPDILIQPDSLEFGDLNLSQTENKVFRITNNSIIRVKCKPGKTMNIMVKPESVWLKSGKAKEFLVTLAPKCAGPFKSKLKVQILAESDNLDGSKVLAQVAVYSVTVSYTAHDVPSASGPKIGLGITPLITDEVGLQKDLIVFKDAAKFPYAAMLGLKKGFKPDWMKVEKDKLNNVDNALVAMPNDRPRDLHSWPKDKVCRSIFKGFFRYSPPEDLAYTLSPEGRIERKKRVFVWNKYISKRLKGENDPTLKEIEYLEYKPTQDKDGGVFHCVYPTCMMLKTKNKESEIMPKFSLVPLSPIYLFNIKVEPKLINFSMVAVATTVQQTVTINNENGFPISVRFTSWSSNVSMEDETKTVNPHCTVSLDVYFETKEFGRYFGFISYVVNGAHEFKITVSAFAFSKTLFVADKSLAIGSRKYDPKAIFQPKSVFLPLENVFPSPVKYRLVLAEDTAFDMEITEGVVPPKSTILAEFLFNVMPWKSLYSEVGVISEGGHTELVKLTSPHKKVFVYFLTSDVDMQDIPLNLPTKVTPQIVNAGYHDVSFEVLTLHPIPGVTVLPSGGVIRARSFYHLDIVVQIPVIMRFSFRIILNVHFCNRLSMNLRGNVVCPIIRIRPSEVTMGKICDQSFDTTTICAFNEGTTRAEVKVDFTLCPEFKVVEGESEFTLLPNQSTRIVIRLDSNNVARYVFYLPIIINRILGPPMIQDHETEFVSYYISDSESSYEDYGEVLNSLNARLGIPCVCINCTVTHALLRITPLSLDFRAENLTKPQTITLTNVSEDEVKFCIITTSLGDPNESPFQVSLMSTNLLETTPKSMKVFLKPQEDLILSVKFLPKKYGNTHIELPIYVSEYKNGGAYNCIQLNGNLKAPRIYPESSEVYFPPLPLGVACDVTLTVCAENYCVPDSLNFWIWDPVEGSEGTVQKQLTAKWLGEPNITERNKTHRFQLQVTFQSFVPVGLRCYIIVVDSRGVYAIILVMAVADNSAMTNHIFLNTKTSMYKLVRNPVSTPVSKMKPDEGGLSSSVTKYDSVEISSHSEKSRSNVASKSTVEMSSGSTSQESSESSCEPVDEGPMLVMQTTKSVSRITQLNFVKVLRNESDCKSVKGRPSVLVNNEPKISFFSKSESLSKTITESSGASQKAPVDEITYPDFPSQENIHWKYFNRTLLCVERWMFEVVMRFDQYLYIPQSFQKVLDPTCATPSQNKKLSGQTEKDFIGFLEEILGSERKELPKRPLFPPDESGIGRACAIRTFFHEVLSFLQRKGCLLPHVRAEHLMEYDDYAVYAESEENIETIQLNNSDRRLKSLLKPDHDTAMPNQSSARSKLEKDTLVKEASSVLFPKDFWEKSLSEQLPMMDSDPEKLDELSQLEQNFEPVSPLFCKKELYTKPEVLDKSTFHTRSTQAWLDVIIQIFRVFVLTKIDKKDWDRPLKVHEMSDKKIVEIGCISSVRNYGKKKKKGIVMVPKVDSLRNNIYTVQERILLAWLNHHLQVQKDSLWHPKDKCYLKNKVLNNFDKALSDSVALISLTASYCPYIVPQFFKDVFVRPETPNQFLHNACRLIQAWRTVPIGLSVESQDIIRPGTVFMVMLVSQLFEVLPLLQPHSVICFSAPLNSEISRKIQVRNESHQRLVYQAKFFGVDERFFHIDAPSTIEIKPLKTITFTVSFSVRQIRKMSVTLFLCGCTVSPDFAKHITFHLEGEPSNISEYEKMPFSAPMYHMICTDIVVKPPYSDPTTYEVWYTTKRPQYSGQSSITFKPWSSICRAKVSRRLFLKTNEVTIKADRGSGTLGVSIACLTNKKRNFWLLFRSEIGDFIILIEISTKPPDVQTHVTGFYSDSWSPTVSCTCNPQKVLSEGCPLLTTLKIPARNEPLMQAQEKMFLKSLHPRETPFWKEHFGKDIGVCLILWFLDSEEEEVIDEFVDNLATRVTYKFTVGTEAKDYVTLPDSIEITDVRGNSEVTLPIHISNEAPERFEFKLTMTSENKKEIRNLKVVLQLPDLCRS